MATKKNSTFTTPKGIAEFAWLNTMDTAFNQNHFKVQLRMSADDAKDFIKDMKQFANDNLGDKAKGCDMPYSVDKETGEVVLKFKSKYKPKFADASGQLASVEPRVGSGSTIKIKGNFYPYDTSNVGVSLQMSAVQVLDLVEFGGVAFDAEEGSFNAAQTSNDNEPNSYDF